MGTSSYSTSERSSRAASAGYFTKSVEETFSQSKAKTIHESMSPKGVKLREARDSEAHPNSVPILLGLDVTGSMGLIPAWLVKEGLPKTISSLIQHGIKDPQLLFTAIGDTECDRFPLQVGQFESGDLELDTWLTRTYLEKGGGSNSGESYLLAWYFAAYHTATDSFEKRKQKGFLFTTGDEPGLKSLPKNVIDKLMGDASSVQKGFTDTELLAAAQEKWHVYHLNVIHGGRGEDRATVNYWKDLLGQNYIEVRDETTIADKIVEIVTQNTAAEIFVKDTKGEVISGTVIDGQTEINVPIVEPEIIL